MNIFLWILQVLLALHTVAGALWKLSNSEQVVSSLQQLPHAVWLALSVVEVLAALALIAPAMNKRLGRLAVVGAFFVTAEMLVFCALHLASGMSQHGEMFYWLVVAVVSGFLGFARLKLKPIA